MNIQEIIAKFTTTNEEGVATTDYEAVNKEVEAINQIQIGAVAKKTKDKYKIQIEEKENELKELQKQTKGISSEKDEVLKEFNDKISNISKELENMKQEKLKKRKEREFIEKAKALGVDEEIQKTFISSGADLEKVNLENFKDDKIKLKILEKEKKKEKTPQKEINATDFFKKF